jgi:hypothetical protein
MRDLAFNFDPPPEAQHVSSELTQAKLDEFRQMPWIEPDLKQTTLEGLQVVERYWRRYSPSGSAPLVWVCLWGHFFPDFWGRYCRHIDVNHRDALLRKERAMYMNFIDWMARTSREKKKQTYSTYWKRLCIYYSLLARRQMPDNVLKQMRRV